MLGLSNVSIKKVMKCLDDQSNITSLCNFGTSCFRVNQLAVLNDFYKLKQANLTLRLQNNHPLFDLWRPYSLEYLARMRKKKELVVRMIRNMMLVDHLLAILPQGYKKTKIPGKLLWKYPLEESHSIQMLLKQAISEVLRKFAMLDFSSNSIKTIVECLDGHNNIIEIINLRKACFRLNRIGVQNDFHKLKPSAFTLTSFPAIGSSLNNVLCVHIGLGLREYYNEKKTILRNRRNNEDRDFLADHKELIKMMNKQSRMTKTYRLGSSKSMSDLVENAFIDALQKVRSINKITINGLKLDSQLLETIKHFTPCIRGAKTIHLSRCAIQWTHAELFTFLTLFENLTEVCLSGKFREPIVADKHLSLISDKITVINEAYSVLHFPDITLKICENWSTNAIKMVNFGNISTGMSFSAIKGLAEKLKLEEKESSLKSYHQCKLKFGALQLSEEEYRKIILVQRRNSTEWKYNEAIEEYTVLSKSDNYSYQFTICWPYKEPNFAKLLAKVRQTREEADAEGNTPEDLSMLRHRLMKIRMIVVDYRERNKQAFANFCEEIILEQIRQQEESVAEEIAEVN